MVIDSSSRKDKYPDSRGSGSTVRDAAITAVGFGSAAASLGALSGSALLLALALISAAAGLLVPHRRLGLGLYFAAFAFLSTAAGLSLLSNDAEQQGQAQSDVHYHSGGSGWDSTQPELGAANRARGFYPARQARICQVSATCTTGPTAALNSLVFAEGGYLQGTSDERRFLAAQKVTPQEWVEPLHDPLIVKPGDTIRVSGLIDNSATHTGPHSTAKGVRVLIGLPPGNGKRITLLSSISSINTVPAAISDSVTIESKVPIFLTLEREATLAIRPSPSAEAEEEAIYDLPPKMTTRYIPNSLDRRQLAGRGVLVGCHRPNGLMPPGRACSLRFQAILRVLYAATAEDTNSLGGIAYPPLGTASALIRGGRSVSLFYAPEWGESTYTTVSKNHRIPVDCRLRSHGTTWYHVSNADEEAYNSGFVSCRRISAVKGYLSTCFT
jgi:hypothetical protein